MTPEVMMDEMEPVQTAPLGQQATWPAKSAAQMAEFAQQRPGAPRLVQLL
jgi:hypothetical protein